ncbi:hypothetical protein ACFL5F_07810 [Planctomycetota bacterium]
MADLRADPWLFYMPITTYTNQSDSQSLKSRSLQVIAMVEKQSEIGRDTQLAILLRHKCQAEIEKAVDNVKMGVVPYKKRTKNDKWFRKQFYRSMMRDRKKKARNGKVLTGLEQRALEHPEWRD